MQIEQVEEVSVYLIGIKIASKITAAKIIANQIESTDTYILAIIVILTVSIVSFTIIRD